jgi:DNA polymerase bacteriophage-type
MMSKKFLTIDLETYSSRDLAKCGVYAYAEAEDFEILLFGYAFDEEEVRVIDFKSGEVLPEEIKKALCSEEVTKCAYNANFERVCLEAYFKVYMPPKQWRCTMVQALELGLPGSLEAVSKCLKLPQQKLAEGKALVKHFSIPCAEKTAKGYRNRNLPEHNKEKWETFKSYCKRDVEVERSIRKRLSKYEITDREQKLWCLDQRINGRGVRVKEQLIKQAVQCHLSNQESLKQEASQLTGIQNPNSAAQMKKWLSEAQGIEVESLSKENVAALVKEAESEQVKKVLQLRQELSKTSIKKYEAMERARCRDSRIRGLFQFYGASRTGRWAGRLVQVQNLPQNKLKDLDRARELLESGQYEALEMLFNSVPEVLSQLIRTAFIPSKDSRFIVADFSAIEARVIAWMAGESWRMDVFKSHGRIYEASAAHMFKVPIGEIHKDSPLRQKGKIAELALGYQGGISALKVMGALKLGLTEKELPDLVIAWRNSNPHIVRLWSEVEKAAVKVVRDNTAVRMQQSIEFSTEDGILFIRLPSGRKLAYVNPRLERDERYDKPKITYDGLEQTTKQWGRLSTYGGKLTENIVQAIARDCLAEAMLRLEEAGYKIVMHVHDEVVLEVPCGFGSVEEVQEIMASPIAWAKGLPLTAEVFETGYYKK